MSTAFQPEDTAKSRAVYSIFPVMECVDDFPQGSWGSTPARGQLFWSHCCLERRQDVENEEILVLQDHQGLRKGHR